MGLDIYYYNNLFLTTLARGEPPYNDALDYGVQIMAMREIVALRETAAAYWRVIGVHHLTAAENGGNHNMFCDVLDEGGRRIDGAYLQMVQGSLAPVYARIDKPPHEAGTNFPVWGETPVTVRVTGRPPAAASLPGEAVTGLRINHPDEEAGNSIGHHSFYVVFQRTLGGSVPPQPEPPTPEPPETVGHIQVRVRKDWLDGLRVDEAGMVTFEVEIG